MHTPKLFAILSHLEKEEWTSWLKSVKGQAQEGHETWQLLEIIQKNRSRLSEIGQAEDLKTHYFPHRSVKYVSNLLSIILTWTEDWIVLNQLSREAHQKDLAILRWFNERGLYSFANATAATIHEQMDGQNGISLFQPFIKMQANFNQHYSHNNIKNEVGPSILQHAVLAFHDFVINSSLVFLCELSNWGKIQDHNFELEESVLSKLVATDMESRHRQFLYDLLALVRKPDLKTAEDLKTRLFAGALVKNEVLHTIATIYITRSLTKMHVSGQIIPRHYFMEMIEYGLENGVYSSHGKLSALSFHNLVMTMSVNGDFESVNNFIAKWAPRVNTRKIESTIALAQAQNCFYHHRFKEILRYTWRSDFEFYSQKILALCLHSIACFMFRKDEVELYLSSIASFKNSLNRNKEKLTPHEFKTYSNLLDFMKRCDEEAPAKIELSDYDVIIFRNWCRDVIDGKFKS
jgi:hypothetical protein